MTEPTGFVLWLTGLSGAGKSTLATAVSTELSRAGIRVEVLDGDEVRQNLSRDLGFSREDRDTNIMRIGYVARLLARHGVGVIVAAVSPYRDARDAIRADVDHFIEVHVDCPLDELERRDVKGLYARARSGDVANLTGVDDPYEPPEQPEVYVNTAELSVGETVRAIVDALRSHVPEMSTAFDAPV